VSRRRREGQLATGAAPYIKSAVAFEGPVLIAIYVFTAVLALAALGDARMVLAFLIFWMIRVRFTGWREPKKPQFSAKALD
jgi:hypothetical protein